jgi:hypothetical protein
MMRKNFMMRNWFELDWNCMRFSGEIKITCGRSNKIKKLKINGKCTLNEEKYQICHEK